MPREILFPDGSANLTILLLPEWKDKLRIEAAIRNVSVGDLIREELRPFVDSLDHDELVPVPA